MARMKLVNGVEVPMTPEDEASLVPNIAHLKAQLQAQIRSHRNIVEQNGVTSGGRMIKADPETINRLLQLQAASNPGQQVPVELANGATVTVPSAALNGLIQAAQARLLAAANAAATKSAEVEGLSTVDALLAYDTSTGWPA